MQEMRKSANENKQFEDKAITGTVTVVNRALPSMHGELFEITFTALLILFQALPLMFLMEISSYSFFDVSNSCIFSETPCIDLINP